MSDEEDYMSDAFLLKLTEPKQPNTKKVSEYTPPIKIKKLEQINRNEGLEKKISSDNKGYTILLKMGYKPGKGLGKDESGRVEPIAIDFKNNKVGLGEKTSVNDKIEHNKALYEDIKINYRLNMSKQYEEKNFSNNLNKIQRICRDLDMERDLRVPVKNWYWPDYRDKKANYDEEIEEYFQLDNCDDFTDEEKLLYIYEYLRKMFFYCFWCGSCYTDELELADNCPGFLKEDHE